MRPRARPGRSRRRVPASTRLRNAAAILSCIALGCVTPRPGEPLPRWKDEISVCGELIHTGTRVVLWNDPQGYDAYRVEPRFPVEMSDKALAEWKSEASYHSIRGNLPAALRDRVSEQGWERDWLAEHIDQFVIHFDVCGTSRQCFKVLHDERNLSVHFLLDVDGTIYQTLDLKERAWHAAEANDRSIGIEIAHIGAYGSPNDPVLKQWYTSDEAGPKVVFPNWMKQTGILTRGFVARPARRALLSGKIGKQMLYQYDFTEEQYRALAKLTATLVQIFPKIELDAPRASDGSVVNRALTQREYEAFRGILGHYHVTDRKSDPGPAFDWDRVLSDARAILAGESPFAAAGAQPFTPLVSLPPVAPKPAAPTPLVSPAPVVDAVMRKPTTATKATKPPAKPATRTTPKRAAKKPAPKPAVKPAAKKTKPRGT